MSLIANLLAAYDPSRWAWVQFQWKADRTQRRILRSRARRIALNCCRQFGKSTCAAIKSAHVAIHEPDSLILLLAAVHRQSGELFRKVRPLVLDHGPGLIEDTQTSLVLTNGSRIICLPGHPDWIRGYSAPRLVIIDEAARASDELFTAVSPMLATNPKAQLILLSTPAGARGRFFEAMHSFDYERYTVPATKCGRIPQSEIDVAKREDPFRFRQELLCEFLGEANSLFTPEQLEALVNPNLAALNHVPGAAGALVNGSLGAI